MWWEIDPLRGLGQGCGARGDLPSRLATSSGAPHRLPHRQGTGGRKFSAPLPPHPAPRGAQALPASAPPPPGPFTLSAPGRGLSAAPAGRPRSSIPVRRGGRLRRGDGRGCLARPARSSPAGGRHPTLGRQIPRSRPARLGPVQPGSATARRGRVSPFAFSLTFSVSPLAVPDTL